MAIQLTRGKSDAVLKKIMAALRNYEKDHPEAEIAFYRQNPVSVRVRIIDENFSKLDKSERNRQVWKYFDALSEEDQSDISMLVLLAPDETKNSIANIEFEDPVPSIL